MKGSVDSRFVYSVAFAHRAYLQAKDKFLLLHKTNLILWEKVIKNRNEVKFTSDLPA